VEVECGKLLPYASFALMFVPLYFRMAQSLNKFFLAHTITQKTSRCLHLQNAAKYLLLTCTMFAALWMANSKWTE
jgi:hypothetical protein